MVSIVIFVALELSCNYFPWEMLMKVYDQVMQSLVTVVAGAEVVVVVFGFVLCCGFGRFGYSNFVLFLCFLVAVVVVDILVFHCGLRYGLVCFLFLISIDVLLANVVVGVVLVDVEVKEWLRSMLVMALVLPFVLVLPSVVFAVIFVDT